MAKIICPKCEHQFDGNNTESIVTRTAAAAAGATTGAIVGSEIGMVGGPLGGIAGTVPGGIVGGITGWFLADQFRRCPKCGRIFKT
jgi:hypothetical protein